jgi:DNA helicase-2/ATP-dependent DNA helicase PcrA
MAEMFVGTIHAFCARLLQEEVPEYLRIATLDETRQLMLVQREPDASGFARARTDEGQALDLRTEVRRYLGALDVLRQAEIDHEHLADLSLGEALDQYRQLLRTASLLDYTGQLELALDVLRRDIDAGQRLARRVRHVIVDEYQDTNALQEQVVRALAEFGATLTVVGDDDQTIFQWNGADVSNILTFATRYPGARQLRLEDNFRSSAPIVTFARDFVADVSPRLPKAMRPTEGHPFEHGDLLALTFRDAWQEARFIARKLRALHGLRLDERDGPRGMSWSDMAILLRGNLRWGASAITRVLDEEGIPYVVTGVKTLFERAEVRAGCALFGFLADDPEVDAEAVARAWHAAQAGLDPRDLDATLAWLDDCRARLRALAHSDDRTAWRALGLQRLFLEALDRLNLRRAPIHPEALDALHANLGRLSKVLGEFESLRAQERPDLRIAAFFDYANTSARHEHEDGPAQSDLAPRDAVRITTVHRAKGLQWPVVFLPGLGEGRFPMEARPQAMWSLLPRAAVRDPERYEHNPHDERRLFYVAATRAQRFLIASWAPGRHGRPAQPSDYFRAFAKAPGVSTVDVNLARRPRSAPTPRAGTTDLRLSFSTLKPLLECPYRFKLEGVYGYTPPFEEAHGFGKGLHDALAEVHRRAIEGDVLDAEAAPRLVRRHLHLPFASDETRAHLTTAAVGTVRRYLQRRGPDLAHVALAEKPIEVEFGDGVTVEGRIDLALRRDEDGVAVVDLKSDRRAQAEALSATQLRIYALGYETLTGTRPQRTEVWELDTLAQHGEPVDDTTMDAVRATVLDAARRLRSGVFPPQPEPARCAACPSRALCPARHEGEPAPTTE